MGRATVLLRTSAASSAAALLVHCALATSFDGLAASADAGSDAGTSAAGSDGSAGAGDASAGDAGAGDAGAGTQGTWCQQNHPTAIFCEDFDSVDLSPQWASNVASGSTLNRDSQRFDSPPRSLLTRTDGTSGARAVLQLKTKSTVNRVHASYDILVDQYGGYAEILYAHFQGFSFYVRARSDTWTYTAEAYLSDGGVPSHDPDLAPAPALGTWTTLDVVIDLAAHKVTARLGAAPSVSFDLEPQLYQAGTASLDVGPGYTATDGKPWGLHFDNVTFDWQ